jgi:mannose-6-phosphate isomerase-like protein (cupin superfamily)
MKRSISFAVIASSLVLDAAAQRIASAVDLHCPEGTGPVRSTVLRSDSVCTSFLLCIDTGVRPHLHRTHTEHVFVLEGSATMTLGDSTRTINPGEVVIIPPGTPHSAHVIGPSPLKVISVQAPYFDGTDRVWLDD